MREVDEGVFRLRKRSSNPELLQESSPDNDPRKPLLPESIISRMQLQAQKDLKANACARMYVVHLKQVFEPLDPTAKPPPVRVQLETYKKVLETYRILSMQNVIKNMMVFEDETWQGALI
jgi:hypothetical protein